MQLWMKNSIKITKQIKEEFPGTNKTGLQLLSSRTALAVAYSGDTW